MCSGHATISVIRFEWCHDTRNEGVMALYKGAGARVTFHAPSTAITMALFESCRQFFADILEK